LARIVRNAGVDGVDPGAFLGGGMFWEIASEVEFDERLVFNPRTAGQSLLGLDRELDPADLRIGLSRRNLMNSASFMASDCAVRPM